jgi:hypothetical protein
LFLASSFDKQTNEGSKDKQAGLKKSDWPPERHVTGYFSPSLDFPGLKTWKVWTRGKTSGGVGNTSWGKNKAENLML